MRREVLSVFEMSVVLITFILGATIAWSTVILGISPMPSSREARQEIMALAAETGDGTIFELGSGWGNLLIPLALAHPQRHIVGYELSFLPWLISCVLIKLHGIQNIHLQRKNFLYADLSEASVIVCYLYPGAMTKLAKKLKAEKSELNYLISNSFALPSYQPSKTIQLNDFYKSNVYLYKFEHGNFKNFVR